MLIPPFWIVFKWSVGRLTSSRSPCHRPFSSQYRRQPLRSPPAEEEGRAVPARFRRGGGDPQDMPPKLGFRARWNGSSERWDRVDQVHPSLLRPCRKPQTKVQERLSQSGMISSVFSRPCPIQYRRSRLPAAPPSRETNGGKTRALVFFENGVLLGGASWTLFGIGAGRSRLSGTTRA